MIVSVLTSCFLLAGLLMVFENVRHLAWMGWLSSHMYVVEELTEW